MSPYIIPNVRVDGLGVATVLVAQLGAEEQRLTEP